MDGTGLDCCHYHTFIRGVELSDSATMRVFFLTNVDLIKIYNFHLKLLLIWWILPVFKEKCFNANAHCSPSSLLFCSVINNRLRQYAVWYV